MDENVSIVYVLLDGDKIIDINSSDFLESTDGWTAIDEGAGDKYKHAYLHYLPGRPCAEDGTSLWKLVDGIPTERTSEEIDADRLPTAKAIKIIKSKEDLEAYLASHPLQWTDGQQYSITREKQQQLTSKILSATVAAQTSTPYALTWNATGEECTSWRLENLAALAYAIDAQVTALVSYQQAKEVAINAAQTMAELEAIEVDYDTVV